MSEGKDVFQIWMKEQSDTVQGSARAFGEKLIVDEFIRVVQENSGDADLAPVLRDLLACYVWYIVEKVCS
jgi:acyl-CoA oxidase